MEQVKVKEELSVEFVLILPNKKTQFDLTKVDIEAETRNEENSNQQDEFKCETCDKKYANKYSLQNHKRTHEAKIECKICHKSLAVLSLIRHMKMHDLKTQPNQFKCEKCEKTFLTKNSQNQHLKTHEKAFECDKCGKRFSRKLTLSDHLKTHLNSKAFQCNICNVKFARNGSLQFHSKTKHGIGSKEFKCSKCSFKSANYKELELHRAKVHRRLFCKICDQTFMDKTKFNSHQKVHEIHYFDDGKLKCKICEFKCESFRGFQMHFKYAHEIQSKNFECEICFKKFISTPNLKRHKIVHINTYDFQCDHCPKTYQSKFNLLIHLIEKHANSTKVMNCKVCSYETKSKVNLRRHERIHGKTFKCPKCDKKFAFKWNLNKHLKTHGDAKDYKSDQCSYAYTTQVNLYVHKKRMYK
jgi:KRAB domain-containing zinc finger protein